MAEVTTDHETIRKWAEGKGGKPAAVDRTHKGGDVGIIRIMFPQNAQSEHGSLVEISWDEFFAQFEESNLALLYEEDGLFSKIVGRDTVEQRSHGDHDAARTHGGGGGRAAAGGGEHRSGGGQRRDSAQPAAGGGKGRSSGDQRHGDAQQHGSAEDRSLAEREYRDEQGNIHHHTRTYMEQHGKDPKK